ncbi:hypothetical protein BpHYR1_011962 [Brachionus plicatilis]|uniref:Uncharacterized protein n=1 Tax=Brachionus plicatilis TaxID=10195 RepID=A0A3M7PTP0_BRAPC|nr:hypothetical protein BpHYR1_011962 [Brachionus plicatilis]
MFKQDRIENIINLSQRPLIMCEFFRVDRTCAPNKFVLPVGSLKRASSKTLRSNLMSACKCYLIWLSLEIFKEPICMEH